LVFVALACELFGALGFGPEIRWLLLLLLLFHPVYAIDVAWISARKHLLAGIFALAATVILVKQPLGARARAWSCLYYVLSLLSHPIHLLWPLFAVAFQAFATKQNPRRSLRFFLPHLGAMTLFGLANLWYYNSLYLTASRGISKYAAENS